MDAASQQCQNAARDASAELLGKGSSEGGGGVLRKGDVGIREIGEISDVAS